jgi:hypothetical protein
MVRMYRKNIYDRHTVCLTLIFEAEHEDVINYISDFFKKYNEHNKTAYQDDFRINLLTDRLGNKVGICYVYFYSSEMYNIFIGNNPDGTIPIRKIKNPDYKPYNDQKESIFIKDIDFDTPEFVEVPINRHSFEQPKMSTLVNKSFIPRVNPTLADEPESEYHRNILFCSRAPNCISYDFIYNTFEFYCTEGRNEYPIVNIKKNSKFCTIEVTYHPQSNDALFALKMSKKITFIHKDKNYTLFFYYKRFRSLLRKAS